MLKFVFVVCFVVNFSPFVLSSFHPFSPPSEGSGEEDFCDFCDFCFPKTLTKILNFVKVLSTLFPPLGDRGLFRST
jgi:hypothetical protein